MNSITDQRYVDFRVERQLKWRRQLKVMKNDLILKVIIDADHNLNCDFSLKSEQKSAIHVICKGIDVFTTKPILSLSRYD
jgi:hypothetical protein